MRKCLWSDFRDAGEGQSRQKSLNRVGIVGVQLLWPITRTVPE